MRSPLPGRTLILSSLLALAGPAAAQVTVDDFATAQGPLVTPGPPPSTVSGAGILGTERDLTLQSNASGPSVSAGASGGVFTLSTAAAQGEAFLTWDGSDGNAVVLDPVGLGGVDLTAGGANAFRLTINSNTAGNEVLIEVFTNGGQSSVRSFILPGIASPTDLIVPFASFAARLGGGANFASVGAITMQVRGGATATTIFELDLFDTVAASPTTTAQKTATPPVAAPGDTLQYTITISNAGPGFEPSLTLTDTIDINTTLVPGSIEVSPLARDDEYTGASINTPFLVAAPGVLANDVDGDGDPLVVAPTGPRASTRGGSASVNADGSFTYTPPTDFRGVDTFPYQADDGNGIPGPGVVTVVVGCSAIDVNPNTLPDGANGSAYGPIAFSQIGATGSVTWTSTALPNNLTFSSAGVLSGTANQSGSFVITFTVTDSIGCSGSQTITLNINEPPAITSANNVTFTVGTPGTFTVTTTGSPAPSIARGGVALPANVTFVDNGDGTGTLSGTPQAGTGGTYAITFQATNSAGSSPVQNFTLTVEEAPTITSANTVTFTAGTPGTFTVTTTGFPAPSIARGGVALPANLTFVDNGNGTGTLSGTPLAGTGGTYAITFQATNTAGSSPVQNFTLNVNEAPTITSANNVTFTVGTPGSFAVTTTGFPLPSIARGGVALPANVTFVDNGDGTGTLSGTPQAGTGGTYAITFQATNSEGSSPVQNFTLTVNEAPTITSANTVTFTVGTPGSFTVTTTGFPAPSIARGGVALPANLTFVDNGNGTGTLSGTAIAGTGGNYAITFTANNAAGTSPTQNFALIVNEAPTISSANNVTFTVGTPGTFTVTTTGFPLPSIARGGVALPANVTFVDNGNGTGTLSGTPQALTGGTYAITFQATNSEGSSPVQNFTLTVHEAPTITSANNVTFVVGTPGSFTVTTTGFPIPSIARGGVALPANITFVDNGNGTGTLSGTAIAGTGGTYAITFTATNVAGTSPTQNFTLTIHEAPTANPDAYTMDANTTFSRATSDANDLLDNDSRGFPLATITLFGGGSLGGAVTDNAAGATVSPLPGFGTGSLTVNADGSFSFTSPTGFSGIYTFQYRLANVVGTSDTTVTITVRPVAVNDSYPNTVIGHVHIDTSTATPFSVLANDIGVSLTANLVSGTTTQGGTVVLNSATGTFTYTPPRGYEGPDSFQYTVTGAGGTSASAATVSLTVSGMVWFINNTVGAGDGRLISPYNTLAAFQAVNNGTGNNPAANDNIFIFESGSTYGGPVTLLNGQKLIGQDATASLSTITGLVPGPHSAPFPTMNSGNGTLAHITSSSNDVNLGVGNTVRGLRLGNATGIALNGSSFGTLTLLDLTVNTTGAGVSLTTGTANATFTAISTGGGTNGIFLSGVTGGPFEVTGDGASDPANTTRGRTTAKSGGGTIVLGSGGTITGASGAGVRLNNSTNVILRNLTIQSNGGAGINNGGDGIHASTVTGLTLDNLLVQNHAGNSGIRGSSLATLSMIHCQVSANATAAGTDGFDVWNADFDNLTGTSSVNASLFFNSQENIWGIVNSGSSVLNLSVANSEFRDTAAANPGNNGLGITALGSANVTLGVTNSTFSNNRANAIQYAGNDSSGGGTITVSSSSFERNTVDVNIGHQGLSKTVDFNILNNTMRQTAAGGPGATESSVAVNIFLAGLSNATTLLRGTISGNVIGTNAVANSGSQLGQGITLFASGAGTITSMVSGNTVRQIRQDDAFFAISSTHTGRLNVTVTNNDFSVNTASILSLFGIDLTAGTVGTDTGTLCANLFGNVAAIGEPTLWGIQAQTVTGNPTIDLQGYGGAANNLAQIKAFLNTTATTVSPPAEAFVFAGTIKAATTPCPTP